MRNRSHGSGTFTPEQLGGLGPDCVLEADVLVVACGTDTPRVAGFAGVRVPLKESPGVLVHVPPQPRLVQRVVLAPVGNIKQKPDGRVVAGSDFASGGGDTSHAAGERLLKTMATVLPEPRKAR